MDSCCLRHLLLVKTCGNDKQKQALKLVILGLDPGIQRLFNIDTKNT
jgi:hypothetical protein